MTARLGLGGRGCAGWKRGCQPLQRLQRLGLRAFAQLVDEGGIAVVLAQAAEE